MENTTEMPQKYIDMVGTRRTFSGGLFSTKKAIEPTEYDIKDWRWGRAKICDMETMEMKHPTVEFLIKKEGMRASRWTRPFPVREIELEPENL